MTDLDPQHELYTQYFDKIAVEVDIAKGRQLSLDKVYYLKKGICALSHITSAGEESSYLYFKAGMLLGFLHPVIEAVGLANAITSKRFQHLDHSIVTKTDCRFLCIPGGVFMDFLEKNPSCYKLLVRSLAENLINVLAVSTNISEQTAMGRVCQIIYDFMDEFPPHKIPRYLTYNEIAFYLSMHVVTVAKIFKSLRKNEIIKKEGNTSVVIDKERLLRILYEDETLKY